MLMGRKEIIALLKPAGIKVVYGYCEQGQEPDFPYAILNYLFDNNVRADNTDYLPRARWQLDLITAKRDEATESAVESGLRSGGLLFSKTQDIQDNQSTVYPRFRMTYRFTTLGE